VFRRLPVLPVVGPLAGVVLALAAWSLPAARRRAHRQRAAHTRRPAPAGHRGRVRRAGRVGPVLALTAEHVPAYPGAVDAERLEQCRGLRNLQVLAAIVTDDIQGAELHDDVVARLRPWRD